MNRCSPSTRRFFSLAALAASVITASFCAGQLSERPAAAQTFDCPVASALTAPARPEDLPHAAPGTAADCSLPGIADDLVRSLPAAIPACGDVSVEDRHLRSTPFAPLLFSVRFDWTASNVAKSGDCLESALLSGRKLFPSLHAVLLL